MYKDPTLFDAEYSDNEEGEGDDEARGSDEGVVSKMPRLELPIGMYYNSWRVGLSYDVNYSPLNVASNYRGGWEISVIYILRELLPKRRNFKHCPNFI